MSPFKAVCRDCSSELFGQNQREIGELMVEHHNQAREAGSWTSAACGIFFVEETDGVGKKVNERWLESTMGVVAKPWTGEIWFDPRRKEGR